MKIPLHNRAGEVVAHALVDAEDYPALSQHRWHLATKGYVLRGVGKQQFRMHRVILGLTDGDGLVADHVNGDKLDNRRENLRVVTPAENAQNQGGRGGTSRHRGVHFYARTGRWRAGVKIGYRLHHLGYFDTEEEAAAAVAAYRAKHLPFSADARRVCDENETQEVAA